ncbi:MAG TPA: ribonuclease HI [Rectinemataceae bacterium]|nr:ribonuclease HI [Rectinemataceae bacterium]
MKEITIYTDGGCSGNPGPGGWAYVYEEEGQEFLGSGGEAATTNNRMELRAVIEALSFAESRGHAVGAARGDASGAASGDATILVLTDSQYVKNGITTWIANWKRNGWRTSDKKAVKNRELWEELDLLVSRTRPRFQWVEGHAGVENNERCDAMVQAEIRKLR